MCNRVPNVYFLYLCYIQKIIGGWVNPYKHYHFKLLDLFEEVYHGIYL